MIHRFSLRSLLCCLMALALLGGCSGKGGSVPSTTVGVGVLLGLSGTNNLTPGGSVTVTAQVLNDVGAKGVTWSLSGDGTLSSATNTQVTYTAPATLTGVATATITATSIADATKYSNVSAVTSGTPQLLAQNSLPANQHVGYGTSITATGGVSPYRWDVIRGQLPPGLQLNGSTSASLGISGTPTALGSWTFTVQVTDANSRIAQGSYTIQVNPQGSCLLSGTFAYKLNGFTKTGGPATRTGTFTVNANGDVTGVQDVKADIVNRMGEPVTAGRCFNQLGNHGQITFTSATGTLTFGWGILASLDEGFMQEMDGSGIAGTANFVRVDPTATAGATGGAAGGTLPAAGDYAFGLYGTDGALSRMNLVGQVALAADGTISSGTADSNGSAGLSGSPVTGKFTADASYAGRGTATLSMGGLSRTFIYYLVYGRDGRRIFLIDSESAADSAILVGDLTPQTGTPYSSLSFAPAATPAVLEIESAVGTHYPTTTSLLAQFSQGSGGLQAVVDTATGGSNVLFVTDPATASVHASTGRVALSFGTGTALRQFVGYLTSTSKGYVLETTANKGDGAGYLEGQSNQPYTNFQGGTYLATTIIPGTISPISLLPDVSVSGGSIGGGFSGQYALDSTSGRGVALLNRDVFGGTGLVFYLINDSKIVLMGNGANSINTQLGYMFF